MTLTIVVRCLQKTTCRIRRIQSTTVNSPPLHIGIISQELEKAIVTILYLCPFLTIPIGIIFYRKRGFATIG